MLPQDAISQVKVDLPKEFLFAIIFLLLGFIGWVGLKYYNRLETILERVDTAIEGIQTTNILLKSDQDHMKEEQKNLEQRVAKLEETKRRRP